MPEWGLADCLFAAVVVLTVSSLLVDLGFHFLPGGKAAGLLELVIKHMLGLMNLGLLLFAFRERARRLRDLPGSARH